MKVSEKLEEIAENLKRTAAALEVIHRGLAGAFEEIQNEIKTLKADERIIEDAKAEDKPGPAKAKKG